MRFDERHACLLQIEKQMYFDARLRISLYGHELKLTFRVWPWRNYSSPAHSRTIISFLLLGNAHLLDENVGQLLRRVVYRIAWHGLHNIWLSSTVAQTSADLMASLARAAAVCQSEQQQNDFLQ